jgi:hypothetical protein
MNSKFNLIILTLLAITIFCVMTSNAVNAIDSNSSPNKVDNSKSEGDAKKPANKKKDTISTPDTVLTQEQQTVDKSTTTDKPTTTTTTNDIPSNTVEIKKVDPSKKPSNKGKIVSNDLSNITKTDEQVLDTLLSVNGNQKPNSDANSTTGNLTTPKSSVIVPVCTQGYHLDKKLNTCALDSNCKSGIAPNANQTVIICTDTVTKKQYVVKHDQPITNNYYNTNSQQQQQQPYPNSLANSLLSSSNNNNPTATAYLLLLDSKQLCLIVGSFQCVAQQNQFTTSSLTTVYDSANKVWSISGTVKDISRNILQNIKITALFYDSKGNPGSNNPITVDVVPNQLNSFEDGSFNLQADTKTMNINPIYIVLNYQTTS